MKRRFKRSISQMSVPIRRQPSCESSKTIPSPSSDKAKDRKGYTLFFIPGLKHVPKATNILFVRSSESTTGRPRMDSSPRPSIGKSSDVAPQTYSSAPGGQGPPQGKDPTLVWKNMRLASFMDVAVLRCLFIPQWDEEGVFWGCSYLFKR